MSFPLEFLYQETDYEQKNLVNPGINCDDFEFFKKVHCLSLGYVQCTCVERTQIRHSFLQPFEVSDSFFDPWIFFSQNSLVCPMILNLAAALGEFSI